MIQILFPSYSNTTFKLFKYHLRAADYFAAVLLHFDMEFVIIDFVTEERKFVSEITFGYVCHFKTADTLGLVQLYREQIKNVFYVTDAVHMTVDVNVAILGRQRSQWLVAGHLDA